MTLRSILEKYLEGGGDRTRKTKQCVYLRNFHGQVKFFTIFFKPKMNLNETKLLREKTEPLKLRLSKVARAKDSL